MKTTLAILSLFAISVGFGQNQETPALQEVMPAIVRDTMAGETIKHCDAMIKAIDIKVDIISKDPIQKAEAENTGWFDQMARTRACFVARREELVRRNLTK